MAGEAHQRPVIIVLAGVNGAGKSSVTGAWLRADGLNYFNPDEAARRIQAELGCAVVEANSLAWKEGKQRLESAIRDRQSFAFESTLGGNTIPRLIEEAADAGMDVRVWFVGLSSPELHLARVRTRVVAGGHDIPEAKIRERWDAARRNIIALMSILTELKVLDNSEEGNPDAGTIPPPVLLLHWRRGAIKFPSIRGLKKTPEWAKPIVARALQLQRLRS
jgi:predicted ABC-type ATPase